MTRNKSFMENGCEHSSFSSQGKKGLSKMVANTPAFHDREKKFYKIEPQFSTFDRSVFDQPGLY